MEVNQVGGKPRDSTVTEAKTGRAIKKEEVGLVECLPTRCETLSSNPSPAKKEMGEVKSQHS
jgi:hypothetical protein